VNSPEAEPDLFAVFTTPLHAAGFQYLVGGSLAAMHYSEPRFTLDVDIPLLLQASEAARLAALFAGESFYCPPEEVIALEASRECNAHFNIIHLPTGLKADFYPSSHDPAFAWAWKHKQTEDSGHGPIHIAPPEYVILWKLEYYRLGQSEKHLKDIRKILLFQKDSLDWPWLESATAARGLASFLETARPG
jgi:hypothetical protein